MWLSDTELAYHVKGLGFNPQNCTKPKPKKKPHKMIYPNFTMYIKYIFNLSIFVVNSTYILQSQDKTLVVSKVLHLLP
jgi:hypothetical protein